MEGLCGIRGKGCSFADIAKLAFSSANSTKDEKGGCAVTVAFGAVGAVGFLAYGVQLEVFDQLTYLVKVLIARLGIFQPFGLALRRVHRAIL